MNHVAIDLGGRESQICRRNAKGEILEEGRRRTSQLGSVLRRGQPCRVILETCSEAFAVADLARARGHDVRVVPATLVRALGVGARGIKTDKRDAQVLSEVSARIELSSVHIPTLIARERKAMCGTRQSMVEARTQLVNCVRGWLRTKLIRPRSGAVETFAERVRSKLLAGPEGMPVFVERLLLVIDELNKQIKDADKELLALARNDPVCQRLMTAPGVGPVTAVRFVAALDDPSRFANAHAVESYLGLTAGERSSSNRKRRTPITKAGPSELRRVLVQASWSAWRARPTDPMVLWARQVAQRRGRQVAIVALARKLAGVLFAIWETARPTLPSLSPRPAGRR
jgi:transposase